MDILIAFLAFVYLSVASAFRMFWCSPRRSSQILLRSREIIGELIGHHGGVSQRTGWKRLTYVSADQKIELEVNCNSRPRLSIRHAGTSPYSVTFYRLPRLLYAFLEAFIPPESRVDHQPYVTLYSSQQSVRELKTLSGFLPMLEKLSRLGLSIRLSAHGVTMWKSLQWRDLQEGIFQEMMQTTRDLAQLCGQEPVPIPVQPVSSEERCAYCKEQLRENAVVTYCSVCGTPHHRDCFELNGKCSVFGCTSTRRADIPLTLAG